MIDRAEITAIVLCGGESARLKGCDKPLLELCGSRIIDSICARLEPQVCEIILSCSRNVALYESLGRRVVVDLEPARGPLAGLAAAFAQIRTEWVLTSPGDTPFLAMNLVECLSEDAIKQGSAVPSVGGVPQNLCLLLNKEKRASLVRYFQADGKAVKYWIAEEGIEPTDLTDIEPTFFNINTSGDLANARQQAKVVS